MGTGSHGNGQASNQHQARSPASSPAWSAMPWTAAFCFFDVADQYGSHVYLRGALKGCPASRTSSRPRPTPPRFADCRSHLEQHRMELGVDYIDIVLLHCMTKKGWPAENQGSMDYLREAKEQKIIRRPRHELPRHGSAPHGRQGPVRRDRPGADQPRRADHG